MRAKIRAVAIWWWPLWAGVIGWPAECAVLSANDGSWGYALVFAGISLVWAGALVLWLWLRDLPQ